MHADQLKGKWIQFKGTLKQQWGKFKENDLRENEKRYDKIIGMLQERYGDNCASLARERYGENRDELIKWADQWRQWFQPDAANEKMRGGEVIKKVWITE
jgi:uncharacterized protein YjbJ (UPF0337 family)